LELSTSWAGIDTWLPAAPVFARFGNLGIAMEREIAGFFAAQVTAPPESVFTARKCWTDKELASQIGAKRQDSPSTTIVGNPSGRAAARVVCG